MVKLWQFGSDLKRTRKVGSEIKFVRHKISVSATEGLVQRLLIVSLKITTPHDING
jgi:hypothetical protein